MERQIFTRLLASGSTFLSGCMVFSVASPNSDIYEFIFKSSGVILGTLVAIYVIGKIIWNHFGVFLMWLFIWLSFLFDYFSGTLVKPTKNMGQLVIYDKEAILSKSCNKNARFYLFPKKITFGGWHKKEILNKVQIEPSQTIVDLSNN